MEDFWHDLPRQTLRSARKKVGLAASSEVRILATLIASSLDLVPKDPNAPISALVSFPALRGLYQEDIEDAGFYLRLSMAGGGYEYHPHEMVAAFAGHGLGLNKSDSDFKHKDDAEPFPLDPHCSLSTRKTRFSYTMNGCTKLSKYPGLA
jgi:hypothetical protein